MDTVIKTKTGLNVIDSSVRIITFQFLFTNPEIIPQFVRDLSPETAAEEKKRKNSPQGVQFIQSTQNVHTGIFIDQLLNAGYELVDAFYQPRRDERNARTTKHMLRFVFSTSDHARPSKEFLGTRLLAEGVLRGVCKDAMWSVCAYRNPLVIDGNRVPDESAMSINLAARTPYRGPDRTFIMVWPKDATGKKMRGEKIKLAADAVIHMVHGEIVMSQR